MDLDKQAEEKTCIKEYLSMWSKMVTLLSGLGGVKKTTCPGEELRYAQVSSCPPATLGLLLFPLSVLVFKGL